MNKLLKTFAWLSLVIALVTFAFLAVASTQDTFKVTFNGQQLEGAQKLIIGSVGFLIAGVATLVALGIAALAAAGSGIILVICLAFVALVLVAIAIPFLLPLLIPILVVAFVATLCRQKPKANVALQ